MNLIFFCRIIDLTRTIIIIIIKLLNRISLTYDSLTRKSAKNEVVLCFIAEKRSLMTLINGIIKEILSVPLYTDAGVWVKHRL